MRHAQQQKFTITQDLPLPATQVKQKAAIHLHAAPPVITAISEQGALDRQELEGFISAMFERAHNAKIIHFMPKLMSVRDASGKLLAACGLRHADQAELFLETYLDAPVEALLSQHSNTPVRRSAILEVGNLAVAEPVNVRSLLASISLYLHSTDSEYAVFTGISTLRNSLTKLNMPLQLLGEARINRIPESERAAWGTYYNEHPQVMAIRRIQPL
ncbi:thermostable hemolysin [mine drainage metagenome]|uniref:Thermostable hemolysin n=1 Tax=mine drainage metagenome TaxID=410659 RepID=A0A1J5TK13_9ZZZZ